MEQDYTINTGAPQAQRIYDWQKEGIGGTGNWFIDSMYCGNCHANLHWTWGLTKFCPHCGFMIVNTLNPNPPEEENE